MINITIIITIIFTVVELIFVLFCINIISLTFNLNKMTELDRQLEVMKLRYETLNEDEEFDTNFF